MEFRKLKGFKDILPDETPLWQHIEAVARSVFVRYGYEEIRLPLLEDTALFRRSIGEATDIVEKEMYTFVDTGGNTVTLRPEGTASAVRAYLENGFHRSNPRVRWYYIGPMFRRERPQKGRLRQFHQIGAECFGWAEPEADAEVLYVLWDLAQSLGMEGSVRLELNTLGCREDREAYVATLRAELEPRRERLCGDCIRRLATNPLRVLDCKKPGCREATQGIPIITDGVCEACRDHFHRVRGLLKAAGIPHEVNPRMVRGLDYYNRTTFELVADGLGAQNAVAAGGRYDGLSEVFGGPPVPALGFAAGVERIAMLAPPGRVPKRTPDAYWVTRGDEALTRAMVLRRILAGQGISSEIDFAPKSFRAQFRAADRRNTRFALVLAEDELSRNSVTVKDMATGEQNEVPAERLGIFLRERFSTTPNREREKEGLE